MSFFLNDMWTPGRPTRPWFSWKPSLKRFSALGFIVELRSPARMARDPLAAVALPGTPEGRRPDQRGTCVLLAMECGGAAIRERLEANPRASTSHTSEEPEHKPKAIARQKNNNGKQLESNRRTIQ